MLDIEISQHDAGIPEMDQFEWCTSFMMRTRANMLSCKACIDSNGCPDANVSNGILCRHGVRVDFLAVRCSCSARRSGHRLSHV